MRGAFVIAGKDLRSIFFSPLFYILSGISCVIWSFHLFYAVDRFMQSAIFQGGTEGQSLHFSVIVHHLGYVHFVMLLIAASITMKLFSEEKRSRTFDLLLTAPVTATEIVIGKLIAGIVTSSAVVGISLLYPLSLAFFGKLEWGPLASSYMGLLLLVSCYVAVGIFASSLTQNSILAVFSALIMSFMLWLSGIASEATSGQAQRQVFEQISVTYHYSNFLKGTFSISGFVFFISVIVLFTFLTQRVVESARWR